MKRLFFGLIPRILSQLSKGKVTAEFSRKKFIPSKGNVIFPNSLMKHNLIMKIPIKLSVSRKL